MIKRQPQKFLRRHSLMDRTGKQVREVLAALLPNTLLLMGSALLLGMLGEM